MSALSVSQLAVTYDETPVLWDVSLDVPKGKLVGIIGPNGAGKSTFIKALLGLVTPLSGKVKILDQTVAQLKNKIAYVPQRESVDWDFPITVEELVLMGRYGTLKFMERPSKEDYKRVSSVLKDVGMLDLKDRQINELSGGQKQRIFIARALVQEAQIYFLDEPFAGIDIGSENLILAILKRLVGEGKSVFVVHHDLTAIENHFDWVVMLNLRLVANGPVQTVFNAETLSETYGKTFQLIEEVMKVKRTRAEGR